MSRHGRTVPTSFYYRFTKDVAEFAAKYARSRVVSVLEGGYSARALCSGAFAHLIGLAQLPAESVSEEWWSLDNLIKVSSLRKSLHPSHGSSQICCRCFCYSSLLTNAIYSSWKRQLNNQDVGRPRPLRRTTSRGSIARWRCSPSWTSRQPSPRPKGGHRLRR
jgi:hypothetical protein